MINCWRWCKKRRIEEAQGGCQGGRPDETCTTVENGGTPDNSDGASEFVTAEYCSEGGFVSFADGSENNEPLTPVASPSPSHKSPDTFWVPDIELPENLRTAKDDDSLVEFGVSPRVDIPVCEQSEPSVPTPASLLYLDECGVHPSEQNLSAQVGFFAGSHGVLGLSGARVLKKRFAGIVLDASEIGSTWEGFVKKRGEKEEKTTWLERARKRVWGDQ